MSQTSKGGIGSGVALLFSKRTFRSHCHTIKSRAIVREDSEDLLGEHTNPRVLPLAPWPKVIVEPRRTLFSVRTTLDTDEDVLQAVKEPGSQGNALRGGSPPDLATRDFQAGPASATSGIKTRNGIPRLPSRANGSGLGGVAVLVLPGSGASKILEYLISPCEMRGIIQC